MKNNYDKLPNGYTINIAWQNLFSTRGYQIVMSDLKPPALSELGTKSRGMQY